MHHLPFMISPPFVPVVNIVTTGTTSSVTSELWDAMLDTCSKSTNPPFHNSLISSDRSYQTQFDMNGCVRSSPHPGPSHRDPALNHPDIGNHAYPVPHPPHAQCPTPTPYQESCYDASIYHSDGVPTAMASLPPVSPRPSRKRRWPSSSPNRHSAPARNLGEAEERIRELEKEVQRLTPRISAAASELRALSASVARMKGSA